MLKKVTSGIACMALAFLVACSGGDSENHGSGSDFASQGGQSSGSTGGSGSSGNSSTAGTGGSSAGNSGTAAGSVYYLNFKPEVDSVWQSIAAQYTKTTGVPVKVVTAANNTYEQTLMSEIANKEAPTLFQINGPTGYRNWKDYCAELTGTRLYDWLMDKNMVVKGDDGKVYGIAYVVEGYGIIYNNAIMDKYFALSGAKAASMDDIKNFQTLKAVVEDMQARKEELGIKGVFASTSLNPSDTWRWQTHLANIPLHYELKDKNVTDLDNLEFTYSENYQNIFDLYLNNSVTAKGLLGNKSVDDSMTEFALGQAAMVQNGNWAWSQMAGVQGNKVAEGDVRFLPIYTGINGEENQGICIGTENFIAVNSQVSAENQAASIAFLEWLFGSDEGRNYVVNELEFITPFSTFGENETPKDPLAKEVMRYMNDETKQNVTWDFVIFPSQQFKDDFGDALLEYASGGKNWSEVKDIVVKRWAAEKNL